MSEGLVHHYKVLKQFLDISDDSGARNRSNSTRAARAREKLLKLSEAQFRELSTDVYDELRRRIDESRGEPDYLLPKSSFHPKRNQARQKLSSLPQSRFKDLVSDISYEIERRNLHIPSQTDSKPLSHNDSTSTRNTASSPTRGLTTNGSVDEENEDLNEVNDVNDEANVSKQSNGSEVPNQTIGLSNKTVVPTKANLTWSSEEEDNDNEIEEAVDDMDEDLNNAHDTSRGIANPPLNGSIDHESTIADLNQKLRQHMEENDQLKSELSHIKLQHDDALTNNKSLSKTIDDLGKEKTEWDSHKSSYETKLSKMAEDHNLNLTQLKGDYEKKLTTSNDKTEYNNLLKEFEQIKSLNATLRLENQSLKNSMNTSSRDHTRSNSRDLNSLDSGTSSPSDKQSTGLNKHMELILDKLSNLDAKPVSEKKPQFIHLRNDVLTWQKKYEDLKANKLLKNFNNNLLTSKELQSLTAEEGSISIKHVTKFQSSIETFLKYIDNKDFNSDILFEKVSSISLLANEIANQGDGNRLNSNENSVNVRDCASHVLSVTRYFTIYPDILPKVVMERSINELVFSVCDLVGKSKICLNDDTITKEGVRSVNTSRDNLLTSENMTNFDQSNSNSLYNAKSNNDDDNSSIGVRPLKMADRLKNNNSGTSLNSFNDTKDVSPPTARNLNASVDSLAGQDSQVKANGSRFANVQEPVDSKDVAPKVTPTKRSNILDRVKQFESPPPDKDSANNSGNRGSFSPGSENESTSNSFILNRSSLEMKKSPSNSVSAKFADILGSKNNNKEKSHMNKAVGVGAAVGAATAVGAAVLTDDKDEPESSPSKSIDGAAASNGRKGIFQSIRDRFTEQPSEQQSDEVPITKQQQQPATTQPIEESISDDKQDLSTDNVQTSTAETTPSKEHEVEDLDVSPSKPPQTNTLKNGIVDEEKEVPSSAASDVTIEHEDANNGPGMKPIKTNTENTPALRSLSGSSPVDTKKKVTISNEPREIVSKAKAPTPEESDEAYDDDDDDSEDEQTTQARQRQEHRKSMAAATFNVDLFDIDDPDNTITQVLLYLEHQTVEVITTIQLLLAAIKKPNVTRGDLRDKSKAISDVISQMTEATNTSMNQTRNAQLKEHGSWVVQNLEDCCHRMNVICKTSKDKKDLDFADRSFKQRLAGISYDIAKCTKELVKAVEEASLKEDIANLDARLSHGDDLT